MYLLDYEKTVSFKGVGEGVFHSVFPLFYNEFSKLRGRKANGEKGGKDYGKRKGERK